MRIRHPASRSFPAAFFVLLLHAGLWLAWNQRLPLRPGEQHAERPPLFIMLYAKPAAKPPPEPERPQDRTVALRRAEQQHAADAASMPAAPGGLTLRIEPVEPAAPAGATPRLDVDAMRAQARRNAHLDAKRALPGTTPAVPESERLGQGIAQAARPDCRNGPGGPLKMGGLLGIPFLIRDTLTDTGCKW